ncbi:MAG: response regulator [Thermoplasmatota archaeon]
MNQRVLLLEDNPADARLMQEAFRELHIAGTLETVASAQEAIEFLDGALRSGNLPTVAILDINLPAGSGHDVLRHIRAQHALQDLVVIMLTTSDADQDIQTAKEQGATTYYIKPPDLDGFLSLVEEIQSFWVERQR